MLETLFRLNQHGATVRGELIAGLTIFLTMAYIIFVNPDILAAAGMDKGAVFVAACIAAAIGRFLGFIALKSAGIVVANPAVLLIAAVFVVYFVTK